MSGLLIIIAAYLALDALCTIGAVGKIAFVTRTMAVGTVARAALFITVLLLAALRGVTP